MPVEGRMLKAKISLNEALAELDNDTHRLLFTWAIPHLDREGRISGSPRVFKATVAPLLDHLTPEKISKFFRDAHGKGLIIYYELDGGVWVQYPKFKENQKIKEDRETPSRIPPPPENSRELLSNTDNLLSPPPEEKRREVKRREENIADPSEKIFFSCRFFVIDCEHHQELVAKYPALTPEMLKEEIEKAADFLVDNHSDYKRRANGLLKSPRIFLRNWLNRAIIPQQNKRGWTKDDEVEEWKKRTLTS